MMHGISTVDGFVEITECMADMIKFVANEPSAGLFYIQQHTQNAVANVVSLKNNVVDKSHETTLHTEDSEDSITMMRSMKECGFPIADEMIGDIRKSLAIMSTKQPRRGSLHYNQSLFFQTGKMSSWRPASWGQGAETGSYISSMIKSAKEKASNLKWSELGSEGLRQTGVENLKPHSNLLESAGSTSLPDMEADEPPLSTYARDGSQQEGQADVSSPCSEILDNFDIFKADKEAKLEEWLEGSDGLSNSRVISNEEGH